MKKKPQNITLIGAGIMSATLGVFLKKLMPEAKIRIFERLDKVGAESSNAWNNAGTGHSAFCELNYTPLREDGSVDITKALKIGEQFEISKQFWAHLKKEGHLNPKEAFIHDIPHMSFVWGDKNIDFLKKRYDALTTHALFEDMIWSEDPEEIKMWVPLMMEGREYEGNIAATRMDIGTDVNFGAITRGMIKYLETLEGVDLELGHEVKDLTNLKNGTWEIEVRDLESGDEKTVESDFVFIGAGGGALILLEKSDIPEGRGYGGFPVSGKFMVCENEDVIAEHEAKVYGKAAFGSPPMSVPHLDTRNIDGKRSLLFGPYAGFSTKFLKNGSYFDLPLSIEMHNVWPMLAAGAKNIGLTKYLIEQVMQTPEESFEELVRYFPNAKFEDWKMITAGQRVQIIKKDENDGGKLQFGTEIVKNETGTLAALLGASPGASTSVSIMLNVLKKCFPDLIETPEWREKIKEMIPTYGNSLKEYQEICKYIRAETGEILKLTD